MTAILRRFLLLQLLLIWQGGFLFYALVVVPIGGNVLGSELQQGLITQRVTVWINYLGIVFLAVALINLRLDRHDEPSALNRLRRLSLLGTCVLQASLFYLHRQLDLLIDPDLQVLQDATLFYSKHRLYLLVSTAIWLFLLLYSFLTLCAWSVIDDNKRLLNRESGDCPK